MKSNENIRALIAEDDYLGSEEISRILTLLGFTVMGKAPNGEQAVKMTQDLSPDVVLMDIKMPKLDGLSAAKQIQETCPTPIVILTAHESREFLNQAKETGVGAYLTKPPKAAEMERAILISIARHADLMEFRRLNKQMNEKNRELKAAIKEIKTLKGILPICAKCKKIRDDKGYWNQVEHYLSSHLEAEFSHGICPECAREMYGELLDGPEN